MNNRFYWYFVRSYEPPEKFNIVFSNCKNYAYIFHNKDGNEPHYHYLFQLKNNTTPSAFLNAYNIKMHSEVAYSPLACFEYLTHKNNPEKIQYSFDDIVALDINKFLSLSASGNEDNKNLRTYDLLQDIINNIPLEEMVFKYGRDYVLNFKKYQDFARLMFNSIQISNDEYLKLLSSTDELYKIKSIINGMEQETFDFSLIDELKKM